MISVVVADDHPLIRAGIEAEAATGVEAPAAIERHDPAIALLAIRMVT